MPRLKSRDRQMPGGFVFFQPQTKWQSPRFASFEVIVMQLIAHRQANPFLTQQHGLSTDPETVRNELDSFNATICKRMGWTEYYMEGGAETALPFQRPAPPPSDPSKLSAAGSSIKKIWSGIKTLNDWIDSGEPAVPAELSAARASVCASCPQNKAGDFSTWFTKPASEAIRRQLESVQSRNLSTPDDDKLNVCQVCSCPMRLKVHTPISFIKNQTSAEVMADLKQVTNPSGGCWIPKE